MPRMDGSSLPRSLNYSLEHLPRNYFGGYERRATERLVERLDANYREAVIERDAVLARIEELEQTCAELRDREQRLTGDLERLTGELSELRRRGETLAGELERARAEIGRHEQRETLLDRRELLLGELLAAAKAAADAARGEARVEAEKTLHKARRREAEIVRSAERELDRLDSERRRLQAVARELREDLSAVFTATLEQLDAVRSENAAAPPQGGAGAVPEPQPWPARRRAWRPAAGGRARLDVAGSKSREKPAQPEFEREPGGASRPTPT